MNIKIPVFTPFFLLTLPFTLVSEASFPSATASFKSPRYEISGFCFRKAEKVAESGSIFHSTSLHQPTSVQGLASSGVKAISLHSEHDRFYPMAYSNAIFCRIMFYYLQIIEFLFSVFPSDPNFLRVLLLTNSSLYSFKTSTL